MERTLAIVGLLLTVPLTGCIQDGADPLDGSVEVDWVEHPQDMATGEAVDMRWELASDEHEVAHTAVHWADFSLADPGGPSDYGNTSGEVAPAQSPGTFDTTVTFDEAGTYHFRAHAIVDGENIWSEEVEVEITDSDPGQAPVVVSIDQAPDEATPGENMTVNWSLTGLPDNATSTAFHWSWESVEDPSSPSDYDHTAERYPDPGVPGSYNATFTVAETGTLHGRAHAIHDGRHFWSDEVEINVSSQDPGEPDGENVTVEIHDESTLGLSTTFEPDNVTALQGANVTWTNLGNATHSIDFENATLEDSPDIAPGENWTWEVPEDLEPGEYAYVDGSASASPAEGTVTVEAPE